MTLDAAVDKAIAIRMTCSNPDVVGRADARPVIVGFDDSQTALDLCGQGEKLDDRARAMGLGHVARLASGVSPAEAVETIRASIEKGSGVPCLVAEEDHGIYAIGQTGHDVHMIRTSCLKGKRVEAAGHDRQRRLEGCVALVTGSAQGFGLGIAQELAGEGACLAVADIQDGPGQDATRRLNEKHGEGTAIYCHTDVTDLDSIESGLQAAAKAFGGLDLFVSNAGVLKAGSLEDLDERSFDLVTAVNYKAYFLGVKGAARIMKRQHELNPFHFMDVVQINSKSGLEGSNKNFAYAGSKFGGIGLTQSFAKELVSFNIKVNSICPGNYFDGPLWSDPENGLFVQYLRAGKVPGAETVEDVKAHYTTQVPMGRGCTPKDVAKAILYLHDQQYETGQALPVTGGQVMLS